MDKVARLSNVSSRKWRTLLHLPLPNLTLSPLASNSHLDTFFDRLHPLFDRYRPLRPSRTTWDASPRPQQHSARCFDASLPFPGAQQKPHLVVRSPPPFPSPFLTFLFVPSLSSPYSSFVPTCRPALLISTPSPPLEPSSRPTPGPPEKQNFQGAACHATPRCCSWLALRHTRTGGGAC